MAITYRVVSDEVEEVVLESPENAVVINSDQIETPPQTTTTTPTKPEPSFIDKYGIYMLIGFVVLVMILMYIFREKIA